MFNIFEVSELKRLLEHEAFAAVLGETADLDCLDIIGVRIGMGLGSYVGCDEYVIPCLKICADDEISRLFKITETIKKRWKQNNVNFRITLYLKDGKIVGGNIYKYRYIASSGQFKPSGYRTDPTQQEIRIVSRILGHLIKPGDPITAKRTEKAGKASVKGFRSLL